MEEKMGERVKKKKKDKVIKHWLMHMRPYPPRGNKLFQMINTVSKYPLHALHTGANDLLKRVCIFKRKKKTVYKIAHLPKIY